jgi:hypothetical protein
MYFLIKYNDLKINKLKKEQNYGDTYICIMFNNTNVIHDSIILIYAYFDENYRSKIKLHYI